MRFVAGGDCLFSSRNLVNRLDPKLVSEFKDSDACFVNAEFTCPKPEIHPPAAGRAYITSVKENILDEFVDLNIKLLSFANNHACDFGYQGVINTIEASEKRNLQPCGIGRSIEEARLPKFLDTPNGRIGVVTTSTTRSEMMLASSAGAGTIPRPGIAPLRWGRTYVLPTEQFEQLKIMDDMMGTAEAFRECNEIEIKPKFGPDNFKLGSLFEGHLDIQRGEKAHVKTHYNQKDANALFKSIKDCSNRSDFNFVSLHTHEGINNNWYNPLPAEFIQEFARKSIDTGADAIIGHGAHFMRGVEIYKGKPIFYNIGSFLMEFEVGESIISPEMYEVYNLPPDSRPSDLHRGRANDPETGKFTGFNSHPRFSRNCLAIFDDSTGVMEVKLLPIDLDLTRENRMQRGVPYLVPAKVGHEIAEYLTDISTEWGTKLTYNEKTGYIDIAGPAEY
ncbi:hypothetical protein CANARDRAFT_9626 [[Candida] arabinofermentans NRRL YB-2248]|uniref:Capsule synthesis protein CapA domain-containing protein n=1 Tax=[Candida] arabinofermentans NRRL YB-2248 TaxID=983967 RepID=A0A1E4SV67_9ASCO|nr:hypothetical protein CANARDRAFT_9626 [[Candida] arabinofermentans NRRL YB-2248]